MRLRNGWLLLLAAVPLAAQMKLEDLEKMALAGNPAMAQADQGIRAAEGRRKQAGLYPNPVLAANGEHNTPVLNGGSIGGYVEQRIVLGEKLGLQKQAADQDRLAAVQMREAARLQVLTAIRELYYQALGEQKLIEVRKQMADLAARTANTVGELNNVGQADKPDRLSAEIEAQRAQLAVTLAENALDRTWREIASLVNQPGLMRQPLAGDLAMPPAIDANQALAQVLNGNPELKAVQMEAARAGVAVKRAKVEKIPDLRVQGGIRYNNEPRDLAGVYRPVGNEGIFTVGVEVPVFDRNQGAVAAAQADAERARLQVDRASLELRSRFAAVYREYQDAMAASTRYREDMIPKAQQAFDMYTGNFRQMSAAYPLVLNAQRSLIQLQDDYIAQLVAAWRAAVEIEGLLSSQ